MFFSSFKGIGAFINNGMSNIYLKVTIETNFSQNFDFLSSKNLFPEQFLGNSNSGRYHLILKLLVAT